MVLQDGWVAFAIAVVALAASIWQGRSTRRQADVAETDEAREEALSLARIRGETIDDLKKSVEEIKREQEEERGICAQKIDDLRKTIDHVREESAETQRMLVVGLRGILVKVLGHLENEPPEVDEAVEYLRDALDGEAPPRSPLRRRRPRAA